MRYAVEMDHKEWIIVYQALKGYGNSIWHDAEAMKQLSVVKGIMRQAIVDMFPELKGKSDEQG